MTDTEQRSVSQRTIWLIAGVLGTVAIIVVALATRFGIDPNVVASPLSGEQAPVLDLPYLEGEGTTALVKRGEITVVNFWASWCIPCRQEHPLLVKAAEDWEDVRIVGVLYQDQPDAGIAFLDEFGRGYDIVDDEGSRASIEFGVFGIPETFFIDEKGAVASVVRGPLTAEVLESTLASLTLGSS